MKGFKNMKTILKVLYITFGLVIAFIVAIASYNVNAYDHIVELTNEGIKNQEYYKVAMVHGGVLDKDNMITNTDDDKMNLSIFPSFSLSEYKYKENDKEVTYKSYDKSYYIYLFDLKFDAGLNAQETNNAGIRFESNAGSYDYLFMINEEINEEKLIKNPTNLDEAVLSSNRDILAGYDAWGFIGVTLTETIYSSMAESLGNMPINKISIIGNDGEDNVVGTYDVDLSFENQLIFDRAKPLLDVYNEFYAVAEDDVYNQRALEKKRDVFYNGFNVELAKNTADANLFGEYTGEHKFNIVYDSVDTPIVYSTYIVQYSSGAFAVNGSAGLIIEETADGVTALCDNIVYELKKENDKTILRVASFEESFLYDKDTTNFTFRYTNEQLQPNSLIWDAAGVVALFVAAAILIYILLFHFAFIKRLVTRDGSKKQSNKYTVNKEAVEGRAKAKVTTVKRVENNPLSKPSSEPKFDKPVTAKEVLENNSNDEEKIIDAEIVEEETSEDVEAE